MVTYVLQIASTIGPVMMSTYVLIAPSELVVVLYQVLFMFFFVFGVPSYIQALLCSTQMSSFGGDQTCSLFLKFSNSSQLDLHD